MPSAPSRFAVFSIRTILFAIALAGSIPIVLFSGLLIVRYADSERARAERTLIEGARGLARGIDSQFAAAEATLHALRDSVLLDIGNIAEFERRARRTATQTGRHIALIDRTGQQLLNTFLPVGKPPPRNDPALWARVFSENRTVVTDVFEGASTGQLLAAVAVPVVRDGAVRWALASGLFTQHFSAVIREPGVPRDWIVSIVDRNGRHMVRSHFNERFAGKPLVPELIELMKAALGRFKPRRLREFI
jgi:hypothetical protein